MENNEKKTNSQKDFQVFMSVSPQQVPQDLDNLTVEKIVRELNPSAFMVFIQVLFVHFFIGLLSLFLCPQFGLKFPSQFNLMILFMQLGNVACMLGCGAIFTSLSLFAVTILLKPEEIRVLREQKFLHILSLSSLSLGLFICFGAEFVLNIGLVWLLGAIMGGYLSLELGWKTRKFLILKRGIA